MNSNRRLSAPGLGVKTRRRSSANYSVASSRRCSLSTSAASSRVRSGSKGYANEDDIELCQPSLEEMPEVPGYFGVTFEQNAVPLPDIPVLIEKDPSQMEIRHFKEVTPLSKEQIRSILINYVDSKCAYDKYAARVAKFVRIEYQPGYKYSLESFTEMRQMAWSLEPYTGAPLDELDPSNPPPPPWSVECSPPQPFQTHSVAMPVPRTDILMTCHACGGVGSKRCWACSAAGWERCSFCLGDGHKISLQGQRDRCFHCLGTGRKKCWRCGGETVAVCRGCEGTGQTRCFIAVTITWSTHSDSHTIEPPEGSILGSKLEFANGHTLFQEEKPMVYPVVYPNEELASVSQFLIEKHAEIVSEEKLLLQRHSVVAIPMYCVTYEWKEKKKHFFIYGMKNEVVAPHFPEQICCCTVS